MKISITKQQLSVLPAAQYTGTIKVVEDAGEVDSAIEELLGARLIGFDTETRPSFKKGQTYTVSLMQLATPDKCFLFRLNKIGFPENLKALLQNGEKTKIGLSIHDDFRNLNKICSVEPHGFIELQTYVGRWNIADKSLTKLYGILFGKRLSKTQRLTNWEADSLGDAQKRYAALDASACIKIYDYLSAGKFDPSQSEYQIEECTAPAPAEK